jgi:hypothetical protein
VRELRIYGHADDLHAAVPELLEATVMGDDLRRADEGEVQGPEKKDNIFPAQGRQAEVIDDARGFDGGSGEIRGLFGDEYAHGDILLNEYE